jgi:hypothetical protein
VNELAQGIAKILKQRVHDRSGRRQMGPSG